MIVIVLAFSLCLLHISDAITCPNALWTPFDVTGSCYLAVHQKTNYYNAQSYCSSLGGTVTSITSVVELFFVNGLFGSNRYWIGLRKQGGLWTWADGTPLSYANWRPSQPDGCCGSDVTCVIANYVDRSGSWDDTGCNNNWDGFVCKTAATGVTTAAPALTCPITNWQPFPTTGSCYLAVQQRTTYQYADIYCRAFGGAVASITSAAEMNFVNTLYGGRQYWIGLRKMFGLWMWSDATPLSYANWRSSQPDGCCGSDVTCAIANYVDNSGSWDDTGCGNTFNGFVCKGPGVATNTSTTTAATTTVSTSGTPCTGAVNNPTCTPLEVCSGGMCQLISSLPSCTTDFDCPSITETCDTTFRVCVRPN